MNFRILNKFIFSFCMCLLITSCGDKCKFAENSIVLPVKEIITNIDKKNIHDTCKSVFVVEKNIPEIYNFLISAIDQIYNNGTKQYCNSKIKKSSYSCEIKFDDSSSYQTMCSLETYDFCNNWLFRTTPNYKEIKNLYISADLFLHTIEKLSNLCMKNNIQNNIESFEQEKEQLNLIHEIGKDLFEKACVSK